MRKYKIITQLFPTDAQLQEMAGIIYHIMVIYGSDIEEKIFYDILAHIPDKYHFTYEDDKVLVLEKEMKAVIENTSKYPD